MKSRTTTSNRPVAGRAAGLRRTLGAGALAGVLATAVPAAASAPVAATSPAAVPCAGATVSATVRAESLPGGSWSVSEGCVAREAFYEVGLAGYRLLLGLGVVTYDDGHVGRIAFAAVTAPDGDALSLVGVDDPDADVARWALTQGTHSEGVAGTAVVGDGVTDAPGAGEERAHVELSVAGTGTDLMTATGEVPETVRSVVLDAIEQLGG